VSYPSQSPSCRIHPFQRLAIIWNHHTNTISSQEEMKCYYLYI
jgi:hypothetical protein